MARLPLIDSNDPDADPLARKMLQQVTAMRGGTVEPNIYRSLANHPQALEAVMRLATVAYFKNSMTPAQRELAYLTASLANDCHY
ncbi:MAG: carboxymuconolactone decarboxylase family protein [Gammaproteobacteria bacterium]|nr:carboxymuconolactone decarboxylase family protein [Gammaproteobacteria bacterium]